MRRLVVWSVAAAALGAVLALAGGYASHWWMWRDLGEPVEYLGAYVPLSGVEMSESVAYSSDIPTFGGIAGPIAVGGAVAGLVLAAFASLVRRRLHGVSRPAALVSIGVVGAVVAVAGVLTSVWWPQDDGTFEVVSYGSSADAYDSALSLDFDTDWTAILVPAALGGAVAALVLAILIYGVRAAGPGHRPHRRP